MQPTYLFYITQCLPTRAHGRCSRPTRVDESLRLTHVRRAWWRSRVGSDLRMVDVQLEESVKRPHSGLPNEVLSLDARACQYDLAKGRAVFMALRLLFREARQGEFEAENLLHPPPPAPVPVPVHFTLPPFEPLHSSRSFPGRSSLPFTCSW